MKPLRSLQDFQIAVDNQFDLFHVVQGTTFRLDIVSALNLKVIDLLTKIKEKTIFYQGQ